MNSKNITSNQIRKLSKKKLNLTIVRLQNFVRNPSFLIGSILSILSIFLIALSSLGGEKLTFYSFLQNLGFNLLGTVCAFIAFEIILRRLKEIDEQQGVKLEFFNKIEFINIIYQSKQIQNNIASIRIMETWTELLKDDHYKEKFANVLLNFIDNNTNSEIQILLLNPDNIDLVEARSNELKTASPEFININVAENIYLNLREIQNINNQLESYEKVNKLKVKLYNTSPSLSIYMCTPHLFVAFFRSGKLSTMGKQLKLPVDSPVGGFINERFDEIWQDPRTTTLEDFLYLKVEVIQGGIAQRSYDHVIYIQYPQGYYIQNSALFNDIANKQDINIKVKQQEFRARNVFINDLPDSVKKLIKSKYPKTEDLFIILE
jgi:hypothetical protein